MAADDLTQPEVGSDPPAALDSGIVNPGPAEARSDRHSPRGSIDWWHRDHPTFTALSGFFTGVLYAGLVPIIFVLILDALFTDRTAREAYPFVLLALLPPIALALSGRTRRFGQYMWIGIAVAGVLIFGVAALVLIMLNRTTL